MLKYYEALLFINLGKWEKAQKAFRESIVIRQKLGDQQGELTSLAGLANLLRRSANTIEEAQAAFQSALESTLAIGSSRVILLNGMGLLLYEKGDLDQSESCFREVRDLARQTSNQELTASALHNLGSIAWTRGRMTEAHGLLEQAMDIQRAIHDTHGEAETLNSLGLAEEGLGNWDDALRIYTDALEKLQETGDFYGQAQILINLGNTHLLKGAIQTATACHQQAYEIAKELGSLQLQGNSLTALGDDYRIDEDFANAERRLQLALDIKTRYREARSLKHTWQILGATYHSQRKASEARAAYEKALHIARGQNDRRMEIYLLVNISTLLVAQERFEDALPLLEDAKQIALEEEYNDCLAWIYEQEGDIELLFKQEVSGTKVLQSFSLALWHASRFNEYELKKLIERLGKFWIAHAEDGEVQASLWFCDSMIQLWRDSMGADESGTIVIQEFSRLKEKIKHVQG
jgi:tetratricopeptide (TPR) repeat protein